MGKFIIPWRRTSLPSHVLTCYLWHSSDWSHLTSNLKFWSISYPIYLLSLSEFDEGHIVEISRGFYTSRLRKVFKFTRHFTLTDRNEKGVKLQLKWLYCAHGEFSWSIKSQKYLPWNFAEIMILGRIKSTGLWSQ